VLRDSAANVRLALQSSPAEMLFDVTCVLRGSAIPPLALAAKLTNLLIESFPYNFVILL
jgi:hypothetical protein